MQTVAAVTPPPCCACGMHAWVHRAGWEHTTVAPSNAPAWTCGAPAAPGAQPCCVQPKLGGSTPQNTGRVKPGGGHPGGIVQTVAAVKPPPAGAAACGTFMQACEHKMPLCGTTPHNATGWVQHSVGGCVGRWWTGGGQGKQRVNGVGATSQLMHLVAGVGGQHGVNSGDGGGGGVRQKG